MADAGITIQRGAPLPLQAQTPTAVPDRSLQGAPLPLDPHAARPDAQQARMRHTAEEFESVFLNEMLSPMFEGLSTDEEVVTSATFLIDAESNLRAALRAFVEPEASK